MIKKIKIVDKELKKRTFVDSLDLQPMTILYACNGSGKSSVLEAIYKQYLSKGHTQKKVNLVEIDGNYNKIAIYKNSKDNHTATEVNPFKSDFNEKVVEKLYSNYRSEGENIMISLLSFIFEVTKDSEIDVVMMDEVDSGLSVEHVNIIFHHLTELVNSGKQVIFTCNTYHPIFITRQFTNMMTGKIQECNTYEEFYGVAVESRNVLVKKGKIPKYVSF